MTSPLPPSDADLIAASRASDSAAFATLYERHMVAARTLARQLVHGRAEADDLVAEAFTPILAHLKRGGGPDAAFRAYLLTTVRRAAYDRLRAEGKLVISGEMETFDPGVPFTDPALADLERSMIARAFFSLPGRWQAVLWHTEIEGARPAEVAALLGLTANGVAALAYRAREGLRQAYLQMHLAGGIRTECRPVAGKLGAYVREGLSRQQAATVAAHLSTCDDCQAVYAELADVNKALRGIAPVMLGPAAAAYLAAAAHKGAIAWIGGRMLWLRHAPKSQQTATAGATAAVAAGIVALALALAGHGTPLHQAVPPARPTPSNPPAPPPAPSPRPAPTLTPAPKPPPRPAAPPRPVPKPAAKPAPRPKPPPRAKPKPAPPPDRYTAMINPVGSLVDGGPGIIQFTVANTGRRTSGPVSAGIGLPPGVRYVDPPIPGGWTCLTAPGGASCTHPPLPPGGTATGYLPVTVSATAPAGGTASITVHGTASTARRGSTAPRPAATARASAGVTAVGLAARYAATGQDSVLTAGARFCRGAPSSAEIALPGQVLWAGLYWSWRTDGEDDGDPALGGTIELRGPSGDLQLVTAAEEGSALMPATDHNGATQHVAFTNVTSMVAGSGSGAWSAYLPREPGVRPSGWSLVVVTTDPAAAPGTQVMVLDGAYLVGPAMSVPLDALPPGPLATVSTVTFTDDGPWLGTVSQPATSVLFEPADEPYLVGVVAVSDPP